MQKTVAKLLGVRCRPLLEDVFGQVPFGEIWLEAPTMEGTLVSTKEFKGDGSYTLEVSAEMRFPVRPYFDDSSLRDGIAAGAGVHVICAAIARLHHSPHWDEARVEALLLRRPQTPLNTCTRMWRTFLWKPVSELPMVTQTITIV